MCIRTIQLMAAGRMAIKLHLPLCLMVSLFDSLPSFCNVSLLFHFHVGRVVENWLYQLSLKCKLATVTRYS